MLENLNVPLEKECDEVELNLELSIGGNYGISRNDVSCGKIGVKPEIGNGFLDLNMKNEIQDKLFLEAHKFKCRGQDRENKEKEEDLVDLERKGTDLNLLFFTQNLRSGNVVSFEGEKSEGVYENVKIEMGSWAGVSSSNRYLERSCSAVSDYQSTFHKGVSSSDGGSHSSCFSSQQNHPVRDHLLEQVEGIEQVEGNVSSFPTESQKTSQLPKDMNKSSLSVDPRPCRTRESRDVTKKRPPRPSNRNQVTPHMPCVSTKGNGPNGKTVMGFLYKYTKLEISIMCVCHGTTFSPAGFVEHAGCVDIENPLRHITVVP